MVSLDQILNDDPHDLRNFTNRGKELSCVRQHVDAPEGTFLPMLMFYGVGGTGKTTFREKLRDTFEGELPCAFLDFRRDDGGSLTADDLPSVLFEVARQLDVICPHFELAYIRFGELRNQAAVKPGAKHSSLVADLAETTVGEAISEVVSEKLPFGIGALVKGARTGIEYLSAPARVKAWRELLKTADGKRLHIWLETADLDEIHRKLKDLLILDLSSGLRERPGRACRALLVFDTLEHLQRGAPQSRRQQFSDRGLWLFELWKGLRMRELDSRLLPFVAFVLLGRDKLDWADYSTEVCTCGRSSKCSWVVFPRGTLVSCSESARLRIRRSRRQFSIQLEMLRLSLRIRVITCCHSDCSRTP